MIELEGECKVVELGHMSDHQIRKYELRMHQARLSAAQKAQRQREYHDLKNAANFQQQARHPFMGQSPGSAFGGLGGSIFGFYR